MIITFSKSWLFLLLLNYNQYIIISVNYLIRKIWPWLKGAMSQIARLLSHHSFGAKNSLERQKNILIKRLNRGLPAPCRFSPRFDIKLSWSWRVRVRNYRPDNKELIRKERHVSDKMAGFASASHAKVAVKFLSIICIIDPVINASLYHFCNKE